MGSWNTEKWILNAFCCFNVEENETPDWCEEYIDLDKCLLENGLCPFLILEHSDGEVVIGSDNE